jgi:CheY-like chemotaxis protein
VSNRAWQAVRHYTMNCILVVDDDPAVRQLAQIILRTEGYDVRAASNGLEALEEIQEAQPSVVLLDLQMPVMDGRAFFKEIDGPERPPVVVMSAYEPARVCRELGAEPILPSPTIR